MTSLKIVTEQMSVILTSAESRVIRMHLVMKSGGHALRYIPLVCDDFLTLRSCLYDVSLERPKYVLLLNTKILLFNAFGCAVLQTSISIL